jgi:hypothetical protein
MPVFADLITSIAQGDPDGWPALVDHAEQHPLRLTFGGFSGRRGLTRTCAIRPFDESDWSGRLLMAPETDRLGLVGYACTLRMSHPVYGAVEATALVPGREEVVEQWCRNWAQIHADERVEMYEDDLEFGYAWGNDPAQEQYTGLEEEA